MKNKLITNNSNIALPVALWLIVDNYDYHTESNYISATGLMKPLRQIILAPRVEEANWYVPDVADKIASALGSTIHDSIEKAWKNDYKQGLKLLGYPEDIINKVLVNPEPDAINKDSIVIYLEQRATKNIAGYIVGGKFDMVAEGTVNDYKTTSAYSWMFGTRDDDHCLQGSIYRWLNPEKITEDNIIIHYIFTDWQRSSALSNPDYPDCRVKDKVIPLMSIKDTEQWILAKLEQVDKFWNAPESMIPECTDEELWISKPKYKYYSNVDKTSGRCTKNFDSLLEANAHLAFKGKGIVLTEQSEPKRCGYCSVRSICTQKDKYFPEAEWNDL